MSAVSRVSAGGVAIAQYAVLNSSGYPYSTTGTLSNGSSGGMGIVPAIKRAAPSNPQPSRQDATGADRRYRGTFVFPPESVSEVELLLAIKDQDMYANVLGLKKFTEGTANAILGETNVAPDAKQTCLIVSGQAKSADDATFGLARYRNRIYSVLNMADLGENWEEATIAGFNLKGYATQAAKFPWGLAFNATTHGATKAVYADYYTFYPLTMHTKIGNNADTQVTLDFTPAGNGTTGYMAVYVDGVALGSTAFSVAAKVVTLAAAPTTAANVVIRYEATDLLSSAI